MTQSAQMGESPEKPDSVAIVGAGVTGLAAALRLRRLGKAVAVYEAADRPGGPVHSVRRDGYLAEDGPNTLLETSPRITELIRDVGLGDAAMHSDPAADKRYLVRHGGPRALPGTPLGFLSTDLFTFGAKLRVLGDLVVGRRPEGAPEESVADFVRRRLGPEFLDYAINPMVGGIYAGDPEKLSVAQAFPRLDAVEKRWRSLFVGQVLGARERRRSGEAPRASAPKISFPGGLGDLVAAMHRAVAECVELSSPVVALAPRDGGWDVTVERGGERRTRRHRAVLLAAPAHRLASVDLAPSAGDDLRWMSGIVHAPVTTMVLGFRRADVAHPLDGFGVLVPAKEPFRILGALFSSSLFPGRAPAGHVALTCYVGGSRDPALALAPEAEQVAVVRESLGRLLGVRGEPTFLHRRVHTHAIPQYNLGYGAFRERMTRLEKSAPGLRLAGHFRDGISMGDCLVAGLRVGEEMAG